MIRHLQNINWKRFLLGTYDKANIVPGFLNLLTLCMIVLILTAISTAFTSEHQYSIPIWLMVVSGVSFVCAQYSLVSHALAFLIVFMLLNAACLGFICYQMYVINSTTLGVLFSFLGIGQLKAIEIWGLFWLEMKQERQQSGTNDEIHEVDPQDQHQILEDEEERI
ncbi:hypothetical protein C9374_001585 [Naegleria lovaniensis]|uniref:Uncharacterized protein n=1 Tax=Naegleria lovaniensis TaxID=51637 RepID=A0AA88GWZ2_NAELO|nr:uncharacterized protein C9374_001585 [Naegleria lovaniensis]KAG2387253.1 hypothetical protein C9374_001585 [Naegleria lovaniensis]